MNIEFNDQEARALLQLLDLATKAGGMQVAPAAVLLWQKIDEAMKAPAPTKPNLEVVAVAQNTE